MAPKPVKTKQAPKKTAVQAKSGPTGSARSKSPIRRSSGTASSKARISFPFIKNLLPKGNKRAIRTGMSLDRKLDIIGIFLTFVGLLTALALLSPVNSTWVGQWVGLLGGMFGVGMYLFPAGLILAGLWMVLRNFERIPQLAIERLVGFILLFLNLLASAHLLLSAETRQVSFELAAAGKGGGYLGATLFETLRGLLGLGGAAIALLAWLVIALALSLDLTVADMLRWLPPLFTRLKDSLASWSQRRRIQVTVAKSMPATDFKPLPSTRPVAAGQAPTAPPSAAQAGGAAAVAAPTASQVIPWVLPRIADILDSGSEVSYDDDIDRQRAGLIEETLASFGAPARVVEINRGPTITQFGVEPDFVENRGGRMRVRVGKIAALADDLALALAARTIRVQAPVPGKGYVGIEVPNEQTAVVSLRDVIESEAFKRLKSPLRFALGQNVSGNAVAADLAGMPHLLVAGTTGSGKSVCVNALICCLLMNNTPDDLRLIMVDPKRVELTGYDGIPHLLAPVVVDLEKVVAALQWVTREMDMRYRKLSEAGSRNIVDFNSKQIARGEKKLPYLVVIIDELADLMMLAPDDTERTITRLAQMARATGIHLVIATQRPSVDVVTGLIKANFPARIAFAVASGVDSRVILDQPGAERLLGRGDMLFQAPDAPAPARLQGVYVSDNEIQRLVSYWQSFTPTIEPAPTAAGGIVDALPAGVPLKQMSLWEEGAEEEGDPLLKEAIDLSRRQGRASISMLQRRLRIGYTRAARLVETMEAKGIVGPPEGATGTREVLDYGQAAPPIEE